jgi:hypothetical protein
LAFDDWMTKWAVLMFPPRICRQPCAQPESLFEARVLPKVNHTTGLTRRCRPILEELAVAVTANRSCQRLLKLDVLSQRSLRQGVYAEFVNHGHLCMIREFHRLRIHAFLERFVY